MSTTASAGGVVGVTVSDTATLGGGFAPLTGTLTFRLYGPSATNVCNAGNLVFTSTTVAVNGAGAYPSPTFTPTVAGTYRWIATYSGDTNNNSRAGTCGEAGETVVITQATPGLTTTASSGGAVGVSRDRHRQPDRRERTDGIDHVPALRAERDRGLHRRQPRLHLDPGRGHRRRQLSVAVVRADHRGHLPLDRQLLR